MTQNISDIRFVYVGGNSPALDSLKIKFARSLMSGEQIALCKSYNLVLKDKLYIFDGEEEVAHTSIIVDNCWEENVQVGENTYAIAKCFMSQNGSRYYFVPINMF